MNKQQPANVDMIRSAPHYTLVPGMEPREIIYAYKLNWGCGTALAYILRAEHKGDPIENLEKAAETLRYEIERRKAAKTDSIEQTVEDYLARQVTDFYPTPPQEFVMPIHKVNPIPHITYTGTKSGGI